MIACLFGESCQLSFESSNAPEESQSSGAVISQLIGSRAGEGPIARIITFLGCVPVTMKPPISALALSASTRSRVEMLVASECWRGNRSRSWSMVTPGVGEGVGFERELRCKSRSRRWNLKRADVTPVAATGVRDCRVLSTGRRSPRWSAVMGAPVVKSGALPPLSMSVLPESNACVTVGPPLPFFKTSIFGLIVSVDLPSLSEAYAGSVADKVETLRSYGAIKIRATRSARCSWR